MEAAMLIGGEWREAASTRSSRSSTRPPRRPSASVPSGSSADVELAVETAKRAFARVVRDRRREARPILAQGRRPDRGERQAAGADADLRAGQADRRGDSARSRHLAHGVRYYAEAATKVRGSYQELPSAFGPAYGQVIRRPIGRLRRDHAVQLPAHAARHQGRPGARRAATRSSPSRRRRRRWRRSRSPGCSPRRACRPAC